MQRSKLGQTSWDCQEELFRQEVENADDIRLSYRLLRKCQGDKQKFCKDIRPGAQPPASQLRQESSLHIIGDAGHRGHGCPTGQMEVL